MTDTLNLASFSRSVKNKVDDNLAIILSKTDRQPTAIATLHEAMQYSVLGGGKRVRPILCYASAYLFDTHALSNQAVLTAASCLELIHAYSLVHDDLPAMDDDKLRRGRPTAHIQYNEATAILAGDALQTLAFETLAGIQTIDPEHRLTAINLLANCSGSKGMVAGQIIDLQAVGQDLDLDTLGYMHKLKTGALIKASVLMGAIVAGCKDPKQIHTLSQFAEHIGLAFQIQDDILDCTADTRALGKQQGADTERNKPTYVSLLGLDAAKAELAEAHRQAVDCIADLNNNELLVELADYIVDRTH